MAALPLFHTLYGHQRRGSRNAFVIDLGIHLEVRCISPLNADADMGLILAALKREPDIPRNALTWAVVCMEFYDRLTIDGDRKLARTCPESRINENVRNIPALACDIEACSAAVAGKRKAERSKGHHSG